MQNKCNANWQTLFRIGHRQSIYVKCSDHVTPTAGKPKNILPIKGCNKTLTTTMVNYELSIANAYSLKKLKPGHSRMYPQ